MVTQCLEEIDLHPPIRRHYGKPSWIVSALLSLEISSLEDAAGAEQQ